MIKAVVFDLDGTLLNTIPDITRALNRALASQGLPTHSEEKTKTLIGGGIREAVRRAVPAGTGDEVQEAVLARYKEDYRLHCTEGTDYYPGVRELLAALSAAGLPVCVLLMPVLPFLEDTEENVLEVVERAAGAGAKYIYPAFGMTQRDRQRAWYHRELEARFPGQGLPERYRRTYGERYWCTSPRAGRLWEAFSARCRALGILYEMKHIVSSYQKGYGDRQLSLFS